MNKKVLLRGPFLSCSGYGHNARTVLRALRKFPDRFDVYLINTVWGATSWLSNDDEERHYIDALLQKTIQYQQSGGKFDISVQVCIPNEWENLAEYNIGVTAGIESTKISTKWFEGTYKVNKMIVTSNHAKYAFDNTAYEAQNNQTGQKFIAHVETPIEVIGYPALQHEPKEIKLDLPNDYNFLIVAQWCSRKNLENTIKYFVDEFHDKKVGLVLKVNSIGNSKMDRHFTEQRLRALLEQIPAAKNKKCSIHLLHGDLSVEEMTYVYRHPKIKALINLSFGEGFGLPIFEAIYNGLPVIAPAWGGQNDFIYMPIKDKKTNKVRETCMVANVGFDIRSVQPECLTPDMIIPESSWSFPQEHSAKRQMRDLHKNYGFHKQRAIKLQKFICDKFETNKMYNMYADAICEDLHILNLEQFLVDKPKNEMLETVMEFA